MIRTCTGEASDVRVEFCDEAVKPAMSSYTGNIGFFVHWGGKISPHLWFQCGRID